MLLQVWRGFRRLLSDLVLPCPQHAPCWMPFRIARTYANRGHVGVSGSEAWSQLNGCAWDDVDPCVVHNSCAHLEEWSRKYCLHVFLDGTGGSFTSDPVLRRCGWGVAVLDFTVVSSPSMVFWRSGGLPGVKANCSPGGVLFQAPPWLPHKKTLWF